MSGWGKGWGVENEKEMDKALDEMIAVGQSLTKVSLDDNNNLKIEHVGWDLAKLGSDETIYGVWTAEGWKELTKEEFENSFKNTAPTHDPYTNPNAHIYYECKCGAILDPGTKSFAALNNCASEAGWKVRWGAESYVPYCVKCGEDVE